MTEIRNRKTALMDWWLHSIILNSLAVYFNLYFMFRTNTTSLLRVFLCRYICRSISFWKNLHFKGFRRSKSNCSGSMIVESLVLSVVNRLKPITSNIWSKHNTAIDELWQMWITKFLFKTRTTGVGLRLFDIRQFRCVVKFTSANSRRNSPSTAMKFQNGFFIQTSVGVFGEFIHSPTSAYRKFSTADH